MGRKSAEQLAAEAKEKAKTEANGEQKTQQNPQQPNEPQPTQAEIDEKLITENPTATPYELLQLGISQSKFEELLTAGTNMGGENSNTVTGDGTGAPLPNADEKTVSELVTDMQNGGDPAIDNKPPAPPAPPEPLKPTLVQKITGALPHAAATAATPILSKARKGGGVWVETSKGKRQLMSQKAAQKLIRMDSKNYRIVSH